MKIQVGDFVKYNNGKRIYKVTKSEGKIVDLDNKYRDVSKSNLQRLNLYRSGQIVGNLRIEDVYEWIDTIYYRIVKINKQESQIDNFSQKVLQNYENQLQRKDSIEREPNESGVSKQLCCRDKINYRIGHRGNKHCINSSKN